MEYDTTLNQAKKTTYQIRKVNDVISKYEILWRSTWLGNRRTKQGKKMTLFPNMEYHDVQLGLENDVPNKEKKWRHFRLRIQPDLKNSK